MTPEEKVKTFDDEKLLRTIRNSELALTNESAAQRATAHMRKKFGHYDVVKTVQKTEQLLVILHAERVRRGL